MSKRELIEAYTEGRIGRRAFVRGLVGLGVGLGVAASYAVALQPGGAEVAAELYYAPTTKDQCKNGGYLAYGFSNQGQCIKFVNTGK
jgi:hypothetical protein